MLYFNSCYQRDDLPILCERFTTSKLKTFEDLTSIGTYGFRGEALASVSHIAHLTITTKTADSSCAWRAHYADGKLVPAKPGQSADPKPTAGRGGTQITVEDLFYNVPSRQKAFRSPSEEYAKILDVVGRYAVHCTGVAFSCKKYGTSAMGIATPSNASAVDCIRNIHGSAIANELISFSVSDEKWGFTASGWATNANYHAKKTTILIFINHRSVESSSIKRALEQTYSSFLPKGTHPFIYLSLDIDPSRVDVNVHPTKREVNFLNEDEIIEIICDTIRSDLSKVDVSRTFATQSLLPTARPTPQTQPANSKPTEKPPSTPSRPYENNIVRTDPSLRKITSMLPPSTSTSTPNPNQPTYQISPRPRTDCRLSTIKTLRATVRDSMHASLTSILASHTYIGLVDPSRRLAAIQSGVKLYLADYGLLTSTFFYQLGLADFGNYGTISLSPPPSIPSLITLATPSSEIPPLVTHHLLTRRAMLKEYFNLSISPNGELLTLPLLLKGYTPSLAKLPRFLMRLGPCVDWEDEGKCFHSFLKELAAFYAPERLPPLVSAPARGGKGAGVEAEAEGGVERGIGGIEGDAAAGEEGGRSEGDVGKRRKEMEWVLEHVLFPAMKARLVATGEVLDAGGVVEVADLKGLYRVFERC